MFLFFIPFSLFDLIDFISYLPIIKNKEHNYISIPYYLSIILSNQLYSLFDQLSNEEWSNVCIPYSLIYRIDVTLGWQLRKLNISAETEPVFTRNCSPF